MAALSTACELIPAASGCVCNAERQLDGIVYCRKEPVLGSRFPKEISMTEQELKEYNAANDEMRRNKDQTSRVCAGNACN